MFTKLLRQLKNSNTHSLQGLKFLFNNEFAARLEIYGFFWTLLIYFFLGTPVSYIIIATILFLALLSIEAVNTAIEVIIDRVSPEISATGKNAKDLGSFAVMCALFMNAAYFAYVIYKTDFSAAAGRITSVAGMITASVILLFISLYYFTRANPLKISKFFVTIVIGILLLGFGVFVTANFFTGQGVDETVIYHLRVGLKGAGFAEYAPLIVSGFLYAGLVLVLLVYIFDMLGQRKRGASRLFLGVIHKNFIQGRTEGDTPVTRNNKAAIGFGALALLGALLVSPFTGNAAGLLKKSIEAKYQEIDYDFYVRPNSLEAGNGKNIVFIYLEGLERTYMDDALFPGLTPNLQRLESEAISYSDIRATRGTGYTIGGIVASQCGVPIFAPSSGNTMDQYDKFMPNAECLGDILSKRGYSLEFIGGAPLKFAGKGKFFDSHGFDKAIGEQGHLERIPDKNAYSSWGLHDDSLFNFTLSEFEILAQGDDPFGLFMLTLDTHHPGGHVSPRCENIVYDDGSNSILNAVKCTDKLVNEFVRDIQSRDVDKETIIVIASDHLALRNRATSILSQGERRNLFMILDPSKPDAKIIEKTGSTLDITPTVLATLGITTQGVGFGRDLNQSNETLLEAHPESYNGFLAAAEQALKDEVWEYPKVSKFMLFNSDETRLYFDKRWINTPVVLHLNPEDVQITQIIFDHPNPRLRVGFLEGKLPETGPFIRVDTCEAIGQEIERDTADNDAVNWCASYGTKSNPTIQDLSDEPQIYKKDVMKALAQ